MSDLTRIARALFYDVLHDSKNLSYVEQISGFKKSKAPVNLFEVMKRLDWDDLVPLTIRTGDPEVAQFILDTWVTPIPTETGGYVFMACDGFDCYYPPEQRRDALIKRFIKDRKLTAPAGMKLESDRCVDLINKMNDPYLNGQPHDRA